MGVDPLFTFAVIADSHVNPSDDVSSSPWEVNRHANRRTARVVEELNRREVDFVVHLGDMVHPVPSQDAYDVAADRFKAIVAPLDVTLHVVPGNHDVGDKPLAWSPAESVTDEFVARYRKHFGDSYYSFDHAGCHFVVLNAQLFNTTLASEEAQRRWLENDLEACRGRRTFVFLHYPPYLADVDEPGHYDNIDEPARSWLLDKLSSANVEALFAGHVHNFFYDRHHDIDCYVAPALSFVRQDYGEFARVPPADRSFGRDDAGKLGYLLVDVYPDGHDPRIIRTYGRTADTVTIGATNDTLPASLRRGAVASVGVDLRHRWSEVVEIPYMGGVDEFARKRVRNDYQLMALWELGIRQLRLPLTDLADPWLGARARLLGENGFVFAPFVFGALDDAAVKTLREFRAHLAAVEVVLPEPLATHMSGLADLRARVDVPVDVSVLHGHGATDEDGRHVHAINHGFSVSDGHLPEFDSAHADGMVFRAGWRDAIVPTVAEAASRAGDLGLRAAVHVRLAGESPARGPDDPVEAICRVAEAVVAAKAWPDVRVIVDGFVVNDRGYFPREGLIDRRYNLTEAGHLVRNLTALLAECSGTDVAALPGPVRGWTLADDSAAHVLLLPGFEGTVRELPAELLPGGCPPAARVVALTDDQERTVECRTVGDVVELRDAVTVDAPVLLTWKGDGRAGS